MSLYFKVPNDSVRAHYVVNSRWRRKRLKYLTKQMNVKLNNSLNVPGNGATKWVTAPEDYDYVHNYLKVVRDNFVNILCSI